MNKVRISLSLREYVVIARLRRMQNGILEVHKVKGDILRTVIKDSNNVTDDDGIKEMQEELSSIAFVGESSIIKEELVSVTYEHKS